VGGKGGGGGGAAAAGGVGGGGGAPPPPPPPPLPSARATGEAVANRASRSPSVATPREAGVGKRQGKQIALGQLEHKAHALCAAAVAAAAAGVGGAAAA